MSRSRLLFRTLLVLLLLGVCWIAGVAWYNAKAGGHLAKAESSIASGDFASAEIHLMNLLNKEPDNGRAHELMSQVILAKAKTTPGSPTTFATNVKALDELEAAARLQPDNLPLQKKLLEVFLARGSLAAAAEVAEAVVQAEPNNADALLALGVEDIRVGRKAPGKEKIDKYLAAPTPHVFRGYQAALVVRQGDDEDDARQQLFDRVATSASDLTTDDLTNMPPREQLLMSSLLQASVAAAPTAKQAHQRVEATLSVSEKVAAGGQQAPELAELIAASMNRLRAKYPSQDLATDELAKRRELVAAASQLLGTYVAAGAAVPAVYLQAAAAARENRDYERAQELLETGIKACGDPPSDRRAELETLHLMAARNLVMMRRYDDAAPHLEVLVDSSENAMAGWGELLSGGVASAEGRHGAALRYYQRAQGKLGRTPFVEVALAKTFLRLGNYDQALPRLEALQQTLDTTDPEQQSWAQLHGVVRNQVAWDKFKANLALGRWDEAEAERTTLVGTTLESQAEAMAAAYLVRQGKAAQAEQRLTTAIERNPESASLRHALVVTHYAAGKTTEAEAAIDELASGADELPEQLLVAYWRTKQGRTADALAILDRAQQQHPESTVPNLLRARILLATGKPREALAIAKQLEASPKSSATGKVIELLEALDSERFDEASAQLSELSAQAATVTPAMNLLAGTLSAAQGDLASAVEQIGDSLEVTSLDQQSHRTLLKAILALAAKEGPAAAATALKPLLEEYPHNAFLHVVDADLLFKQGELGGGRAALDRAERELPASPLVPYLKAATWASAGNLEQGLGEANRAIAIDSTYLPARLLAAQLQLANGKPAPALSLATRLVEDAPRSWNAYFLKAEAERQLGRDAAAIRTLTVALQAEPRLVPAYRGLMSLLLGAGRATEALEVCQQGRKVLPDAIAFGLDEISIQTQLGHLDQAQQLADEFVAAEGDTQLTPAIRALSVAQTFASAGKIDLAEQWAKRALLTAEGDQKVAGQLFLGELALVAGQADGNRELLAEARDYFAEVVEVQPQNFVAANNLAWLLATEFDDPAQALSVAEAIRGDATATSLPIGFIDTLAVVYRAAGETEKARQLLEQAVKVYPDNAMLMVHLGVLLAGKDQAIAAENLLERAVSIGGLTDDQQAEAEQVLNQLVAARTAPANP